MPVEIHLSVLEKNPETLKGQAKLNIETGDDLIGCESPLDYAIEAQLIDKEILVEGTLDLMLNCQCVRCLKSMVHNIHFERWTCLILLEGEGKTEISGDCIDLTPLIRDDVLLEFPQHPLCSPDCAGINFGKAGWGSGDVTEDETSVWSKLNKLNLN